MLILMFITANTLDSQSTGSNRRTGANTEPSHSMEIGQVLLSLLHAWGLDPDLDRVCETKLGLLRPMV